MASDRGRSTQYAVRSGARPAALLLLVALLALCGCAHPDLSPSPTLAPPTTVPPPTSSTTTLAPELGASRFESCLSGEGLNIDPIPFDAQGRPRLELALRGIDFGVPANNQAMVTCAHHLTTGALGLNGSLVGEAVRDLLVDFTACVRARGVDSFPDPVPDFDGVGAPYPVGEIPFYHPGLATAVDVCRNRLSG